MKGLVKPLHLAFWLPDFLSPHTLVAPSKDQSHEGSPRSPPSRISCIQAHVEGVSPHQQGPGAGPHAQTLLAALPREASASAGHLREARESGVFQQLSPLQPLPPTLRVLRGAEFPAGTLPAPNPGLGWGIGCLPTFIPRAQARVLWEAQAVSGGAGSAGTWALTRRGRAWTILLAPTTAPELCIQLLPQCLPGGRLRPLASWARSAGGVCEEKGVSQDLVRSWR